MHLFILRATREGRRTGAGKRRAERRELWDSSLSSLRGKMSKAEDQEQLACNLRTGTFSGYYLSSIGEADAVLFE